VTTLEDESADSVMRGIASSPPRAPLGRFAMTLRSKRYSLVRPLGEGGMGVVYEAFDAERQATVALKTMRSLDPHALVLFKREFRVAQQARHPNLVELGELVFDGTQWFLTMELVLGCDFLEHVRPGYLKPSAISTAGSTAGVSVVRLGPVATRPPGTTSQARRLGGLCDFERLRGAVGQLASGLVVLHEARCIHRDIKPSNIRVTAAHRVVLLDFGLILDDDPETRAQIVGTPGYMAPEQAVGDITPKADLYSVGVLVYEALTGQLPFDGDPTVVLRAKQLREPRPPKDLEPGVPEDLNDLTVELLRTDPERRPSATELLARIRGTYPSFQAPSPSQGQAPFVGRQEELAKLRRLFETSPTHAVGVLVQGESGIGKSHLVHQFLRRLGLDRPDLVVLAGRCHERESVPYKAFDGVVDALGRHLSRLSEIDAERALPIDAALLAQVFPVLGRVRAFAEAPQPRRRAEEAHELRGRVFTAMRSLFARLADRSPLVIAIDDLQWADDDGLALITELLRSPDAPSILVVGTMRPAREKEPRIRAAFPDAHVIALAPLLAEESCELVERLLGEGARTGSTALRALAAEAGGHPLFLSELAERARSGRVIAEAPERLDDVLWARFAKLEGSTRRLLALSVVSDVPLNPGTVAVAARLERAEVMREVRALCATRLLKVGSDETSVEPYHDRLREAVSTRLDAESIRELHERLASALTECEPGQAETIGQHWLLAGDKKKAAEYFLISAESAERAFAFAHAADLYATVLELRDPSTEGSPKIATARARALASAGKSGEAGFAYASAATLASREDARTLRRLAADQLLRGGHIDEGVLAIRAELIDAGFRFPETPIGAVVALLACRVVLYLRGHRFRERPAAAIPASELARIDLFWAATLGLCLVDPMRGSYFISLHFLHALRLGEPTRIARGAAMDAPYIASQGARAADAADRQAQLAVDLAQRTGDPAAIAFSRLGRGIGLFLQGRFAEAAIDALAAEATFHERRLKGWELSNARSYAAGALVLQGRFTDLATVLPAWEKDAVETGDLTAIRSTRVAEFVYVWLAADAPGLAREQVALGMKGWSREGFLTEHFLELVGYALVDLYDGDIASARERMRRCDDGMRRSFLGRVEMLRIRSLELTARIEIAAARDGGEGPSLALAARAARRLTSTRARWAVALATLLDAQIAQRRGEARRARSLLGDAVLRLDSCSLYLHAATARHALGRISSDERLAADADEWFREQGVTDPVRLRGMVAPGFAAPPSTRSVPQPRR